MDRTLWGLMAMFALGMETATAQGNSALALGDRVGTQVALAGEPMVALEDRLVGFDLGSNLRMAPPAGGSEVLAIPLYQAHRLEVSGGRESPAAAGLRLKPVTGPAGRGVIGRMSALLSGSDHVVITSVARAVLGGAGGYLLGSVAGSSAKTRGSAAKVSPNPRTLTIRFTIRF
jgi:hypothetical protein